MSLLILVKPDLYEFQIKNSHKSIRYLYLKKDGMKIIYHTITANYEAYSSFSKIELSLPNNFVRCHKSYVVNVNHVKNILENKNLIVLTNNETCLIGPKYKSKLMEVLNNDRNHKQYL